jgi:hypothetical protein
MEAKSFKEAIEKQDRSIHLPSSLKQNKQSRDYYLLQVIFTALSLVSFLKV